MTVLCNSIHKQIAQSLWECLEKVFPQHGKSVEDLYALLAPSPNIKMGHVAFPAFPLAKVCKMGPPQIAAKIESEIKLPPVIKSVQCAGPYLNFSFDFLALGDQVLEKMNHGEYFKTKLFDDGSKTMIEYSQPNTHKILHVGHMRNLCLGNALIRLARYSGKDILAVTYPGDVGTHVAKCLWYLKYHNKEEVPVNEKGAWLGEHYSKGNNLLEEQKGTPQEEINRQQLTAILKELHDQKGEYYDLWKETRQWSIDLMKESYAWADVEFDHWFWESQMDAPSLELAKKLLDDGLLVHDQGAVGIDLSEDKLGFCLLIKTDGTGLYATKDLLLAKIKFEEYKIDHSLYVVDNRQAHHFKQVFNVLDKMGFEQAKNCSHLQYAMVELPDGAMSSRKGNIVPLMDLVAQIQEKVKKDYLQKYLEDPESGWTQGDVNKTAEMIANGAIKYGMIRVDNNRKIVFDMNEWLKLDGDTGPYLQYVHARISSLCQKLNYDIANPVDWSLLTASQEEALMVKLNSFNDVIQSSVQKWQTIHVCTYLFELGKIFNSFYAECSMAKAESEALKHSRLALAHATGKVIKKGLESLGIPAPERM
jgi:arginyl-tRNA synthetase